MNRAGWQAKLIHVSGFLDFLNPVIQDLVARAHVIIFQRNIISEAAFDALSYWRGMGIPVVVDLDDAYQMLPWSNPAHRFWEQDDRTPVKMLEEGLRLSDGLVAPNRRLLKSFEYASGNSYYLQNYAEPDWWSNLPPRELLKHNKGLDGKIVIGWGGSVSHYDSWWGSGIREAAERICNRHPEVIWMICGNDRRILEQLPVSNSQKYYQPGVPPEKWPEIVQHFDIGVAPLAGPYDQHRSWIKGLEYNLAGTPWVGTAGEPYQDIADTGFLVANGVNVWEDAIESLIGDLSASQNHQVERKSEYEQRFFVDHNLDVFAKVYQQIIDDFKNDQQGLPGVYYVKAEGTTPIGYRSRQTA